MSILLSLISNPTALLAALGALITLVAGAFFKSHSNGVKSERFKSIKANLDSKIDQLEMHREATAIERDNAALSDAEARAKAKRVLR